MLRALVVDDDEALRKMIRKRLTNQCEIVETGDSSEALALALEHRPDCILLDLGLPNFSGLELCQAFCALSHTRHIPIFVITGQSATEHKEFCLNLGASEFFPKPIDFARLRVCLETLPTNRRTPQRHIRVQLKVLLKLRGADAHGKDFELLTTTEEVSVRGFSCPCSLSLDKDALIDVFQLGTLRERRVGRARLIGVGWPDLPWQACTFEFVEKTGEWILQQEDKTDVEFAGTGSLFGDVDAFD